MKVKIRRPHAYFGPHDLARVICFWNPDADWVYEFGEWLAYGRHKPTHTLGESCKLFDEPKPSWLYRLLLWIDDRRSPRKASVRVDPWDTWSMDHTLAEIALPMLKQLKATKQGAPYVDPEDVPVELKPKKQTKKQKESGDTDSTHFERWDWVLDEMIFAFETKAGDLQDWEDQFFTGEYDYLTKIVKVDARGEPALYEIVEGENHTRTFDSEGYKAYQARISNGFRLFGVYYEALWD